MLEGPSESELIYAMMKCYVLFTSSSLVLGTSGEAHQATGGSIGRREEKDAEGTDGRHQAAEQAN